MFIATATPTTLAQYVGLVVYKHFVPTGLRPFSSKLGCYHGQEQHTNAASLVPWFSLTQGLKKHKTLSNLLGSEAYRG
jgi:hypothetical protein